MELANYVLLLVCLSNRIKMSKSDIYVQITGASLFALINLYICG